MWYHGPTGLLSCGHAEHIYCLGVSAGAIFVWWAPNSFTIIVWVSAPSSRRERRTRLLSWPECRGQLRIVSAQLVYCHNVSAGVNFMSWVLNSFTVITWMSVPSSRRERRIHLLSWREYRRHLSVVNAELVYFLGMSAAAILVCECLTRLQSWRECLCNCYVVSAELVYCLGVNADVIFVS